MKQWSGVLLSAAVSYVLVLSFPAGATGQHGTQGPRFLGWGLDFPNENIPGLNIPGPVQTYKLLSTFPPQKATDVQASSPAVFTLTNLSCQLTLNPLVAVCRANVTNSAGPPVCNTLDGSQEWVKLVAVNAGFDGVKWALDFSQKQAVVFACADPSNGRPDPLDRIGAIGKCIGADFFLNSKWHAELDACIRASRADYCGDGYSYTRAGTHFALYDSAATDTAAICWSGECFEASWDEHGAVCLNHLRYGDLRVLAIQLPSNAIEWGKEWKEGTGATARNICLEPIDKKPVARKLAPLCPPPPTNPLNRCLADFTDLYYDDQHYLGSADQTAVNLITAQYACRTGQARTLDRHGLFTRTMVRFNMNTRVVDQLPCCDTLGCP